MQGLSNSILSRAFRLSIDFNVLFARSGCKVSMKINRSKFFHRFFNQKMGGLVPQKRLKLLRRAELKRRTILRLSGTRIRSALTFATLALLILLNRLI